MVFSSPNTNFSTKSHLFRPERKTVENIRFWARFWSQKSPEIDFRSFCGPNRKKRPKRVLDAKVRNFAKMGTFLLRRRLFCANRENPSVANAFLGVLKPISTLFALFRSFSHFRKKVIFTHFRQKRKTLYKRNVSGTLFRPESQKREISTFGSKNLSKHFYK